MKLVYFIFPARFQNQKSKLDATLTNVLLYSQMPRLKQNKRFQNRKFRFSTVLVVGQNDQDINSENSN